MNSQRQGTNGWKWRERILQRGTRTSFQRWMATRVEDLDSSKSERRSMMRRDLGGSCPRRGWMHKQDEWIKLNPAWAFSQVRCTRYLVRALLEQTADQQVFGTWCSSGWSSPECKQRPTLGVSPKWKLTAGIYSSLPTAAKKRSSK